MTIVIPAYNPDNHLIGVLDGLKKYRIIVVDDGSKDKKIFDRVKKYKNVVLLEHSVNMGKGQAMKTAMEYVYNNISDDGVIFVDADGQHKKDDIERVIDIFNCNKDSLIIGTRCFKGSIPWKSKMGNNITKFLFKVFTFKTVNDTQSGLRAINTKYIPFLLKIDGKRYEYEMNVLLSCSNKMGIVEVPIETVYEDMENSTSHFRVIRDSFLIYKSFLKFMVSSFLCFLVDYFLFIFLIKMFNSSPSNIFLCNVISRVISATLNYNLNKMFVFRSNNHGFFGYVMLATFTILINSFILNLFINSYGFNVYLSKVIVEVILFVFNFIVEQRVIFNEKWRNV